MSRFTAVLLLAIACGSDPASPPTLPEAAPGAGDRSPNPPGVDPVNAGPPEVAIAFPPPRSVTDAASIAVRGTSSDPEGVAAVRVNGVIATTTDGFASWQLDIELAPGANELVIEAEDGDGEVDPGAASAVVLRRSLVSIDEAAGVAIDAARQRALVLDRAAGAVIAVDLVTTRRSLVIDQLGAPAAIAVDGDTALIAGGDAVVAVDLAAGESATASAPGLAPPLSEPVAIAVTGDTLLVADRALAALVAIDRATGDRRILSGAGVGGGPSLDGVSGVALDGARAIAAVGSGALIAVDLSSGERELVASVGHRVGQLVVDGGVAYTSRTAVFRTDLATGETAILSDFPVFGDGRFVDAAAIALDAAGQRLVAVDASRSALAAVDLASGDRSFLLDAELGDGAPIAVPSHLAGAGDELFVFDALLFDPSINRVGGGGARAQLSSAFIGDGPLLAGLLDLADSATRGLHGLLRDGIVRFDPATGDRRIASTGFSGASSMAVAGDRGFVASDAGIDAVDLDGGAHRLLVAGSFRDVAFRAGCDRLLALDGDALVGFDPDTGAAIATAGSGPAPVFATRLEALPGCDRAVVLDGDLDWSLLVVDVATGDRVIGASAAAAGVGPRPASIRALRGVADRVVQVSGDDAVYAIDLVTGHSALITGM